MSAIAPAVPIKQVPAPYPDQLGGRVIPVNSYAELKAALEVNLQHLDTIVPNSGQEYAGPNITPKKTPPDWKWCVRGSRSTELAAGSGPVTAERAKLLAPKLVATSTGAFFSLNDGIHGGRFVGLEFSLHASVGAPNINLIGVGWGPGPNGEHADQASVATGHALELCYLHGSPTQEIRRAIMANGGALALRRCLIDEIHQGGFDSQGVGGWNGPGPFLFEDTEMYASSQAFMFGGSQSQAEWANPADLTIRGRCLFGKRQSWNPNAPAFAGKTWVIKPGFELKNMTRMDARDFVVEDAWSWPALTFDCFADQPWSKIVDINCENFQVRRAGGFFQSWHAGGEVSRIRLHNALCIAMIDPPPPVNPYGHGIVLNLAGSQIADLWVERCTILGLQGMMNQGPVKLPRFTLRDNLLGFGGHGLAIEGYTGPWRVPFDGDVGVEGNGWGSKERWDQVAPDRDWQRNAFVNVQPEPADRSDRPYNRRKYWSAAWLTADENAVPGVDLVTGQLAATSPFKGKAAGGGDLGVDFAQLATPAPPPVPAPGPTPPPPAGGSPMQARFVGLSTKNLAGPSTVAGPGGGNDWQIDLTGLKAVPTRVRVDGGAGSATWIVPADGKFWAAALQGPDQAGGMSLFLEPYAAAVRPFTLQVTYPDGTSETVIASEALPVPTPTPGPPPPPSPAPDPAALYIDALESAAAKYHNLTVAQVRKALTP